MHATKSPTVFNWISPFKWNCLKTFAANTKSMHSFFHVACRDRKCISLDCNFVKFSCLLLPLLDIITLDEMTFERMSLSEGWWWWWCRRYTWKFDTNAKSEVAVEQFLRTKNEIENKFSLFRLALKFWWPIFENRLLFDRISVSTNLNSVRWNAKFIFDLI